MFDVTDCGCTLTGWDIVLLLYIAAHTSAKVVCALYMKTMRNTVVRCITMFRSMMERIYDGGPIIL